MNACINSVCMYVMFVCIHTNIHTCTVCMHVCMVCIYRSKKYFNIQFYTYIWYTYYMYVYVHAVSIQLRGLVDILTDVEVTKMNERTNERTCFTRDRYFQAFRERGDNLR